MGGDSSSRCSRRASRATSSRASFAPSRACGATCERIVHLASYPVDCYELVVRGRDHAALREALVDGARRTVGVDLAVQRAGLHRRAKHLVVMDADSTLLQDEVIDLLAEECGCAEEVVGDHRARRWPARSTSPSRCAGASRCSRACRATVLDRRARATATHAGRAHVAAHAAPTGLRAGGRVGWLRRGARAAAGRAPRRTTSRPIASRSSTSKLTGRLVRRASWTAPARPARCERFAEEVGVPLEQTVAVGDGANDIDMISVAGLGIAFNAKPVVHEHADAALSVPYLDAVLYFLGISREEIETE